jgi:hypothetical protein
MIEVMRTCSDTTDRINLRRKNNFKREKEEGRQGRKS